MQQQQIRQGRKAWAQMLSDSSDQLHKSDAGNRVISNICDTHSDQSDQSASGNDSHNVLQNKMNIMERPSSPKAASVSELPENIQNKIRKLEEENQQLQKENASLKENICHSQVSDCKVHYEIRNILKPLFSGTQISALIMKSKKVKSWTDEDIASALTLRSLSPRCYRYPRNKKGFPLPSVSTLNHRAQKFACEPGLLPSVLTLLKSKSEMLGTVEKLTVLSLDEMSIEKQWCYYKGNDVLYKPHKSV
ncbi:uncharacterized protein LOC143037817 [Oratosquilla oratoria]|uniref:uncharacterized protein LOC143037817 n=1 Tax=Oratosquilla oratoria TaxID=337810 RepID=UPI003F75AF55